MGTSASPLGASCAVRRSEDPQPSLFLQKPSSVPTLPWIQSHTSEVRAATRRASTEAELGKNRGLASGEAAYAGGEVASASGEAASASYEAASAIGEAASDVINAFKGFSALNHFNAFNDF